MGPWPTQERVAELYWQEWAVESSLPVVADSTEDPRRGHSPATRTLFFPARGTHFPSQKLEMLDSIFPRLPCTWACSPFMDGLMLLWLDTEVGNSEAGSFSPHGAMREQAQDQPMCKNQKDGRGFYGSRVFIR